MSMARAGAILMLEAAARKAVVLNGAGGFIVRSRVVTDVTLPSSPSLSNAAFAAPSSPNLSALCLALKLSPSCSQIP
jgi:hypothetical protein